MANGLPILYETHLTHLKVDEWGGGYQIGMYGYTVTVRLVWNMGFKWGIETGDFSMWGNGLFSLPKLVCEACHAIHDDSPRYYRLKERLQSAGIWRNL